MTDAGNRSRDMALVALFAALTAVGAFIRIPVPVVPFTLQFLFTNLAGLLLGAKRGAAAVCVYMAAGLIGVPVFTQGGGPWYVMNPTSATSWASRQARGARGRYRGCARAGAFACFLPLALRTSQSSIY